MSTTHDRVYDLATVGVGVGVGVANAAMINTELVLGRADRAAANERTRTGA